MDDGSQSRERKSLFKVKKVSESGQTPKFIPPQIPSIGKRRPLIIRKNNFVTKDARSNSPPKPLPITGSRDALLN